MGKRLLVAVGLVALVGLGYAGGAFMPAHPFRLFTTLGWGNHAEYEIPAPPSVHEFVVYQDLVNVGGWFERYAFIEMRHGDGSVTVMAIDSNRLRFLAQ